MCDSGEFAIKVVLVLAADVWLDIVGESHEISIEEYANGIVY